MAPMIMISPSRTASTRGVQLAAMAAGQAVRGDGLPAGDHLGDRDGLVLRVHGAKASRVRVMLRHAPRRSGGSAGWFDASQQRLLGRRHALQSASARIQ